MRAELKGLPPELAEKVGMRMLAAGLLIDVDPAAALAQATVAHRLAARLPVVRAAMAESAYAAGEFGTALREFRALRRLSGGDEYLPLIADCERAVGRPGEALQIARTAAGLDLEPSVRIEMTIVEAGARADQGQRAEALRVLQRAITETRGRRGIPSSAAARLRFAYADLLLAGGDEQGALTWFSSAAEADVEQATEAAERVAELQGMRLDLDEEFFFDAEDGVEAGPDRGEQRQRPASPDPASDPASANRASQDLATDSTD